MHKTEVRSVTRQVTHITQVICDLCKTEHVGDDWWTESVYDVRETTVECKIGERYPDNTDITTTAFDICPDCFKNKLMPWLAEQGATPRVTETNY